MTEAPVETDTVARWLQTSLIVVVVIATAMGSIWLAAHLGDRQAVRQLAREASMPAEETAPWNKTTIAPADYRRYAQAQATRNAWVVWGLSVPLGLAVGYVMGRGGLRLEGPSYERLVFFLVKVFLMLLVMGVARLVLRLAGRNLAMSYAAAAAGIVLGLLAAIPTTFLLIGFTGSGPIEDVEGPIALRVALFCGSLTIASVAAMLAPMITPAPRIAQSEPWDQKGWHC